jgi:hypothetical protein
VKNEPQSKRQKKEKARMDRAKLEARMLTDKFIGLSKTELKKIAPSQEMHLKIRRTNGKMFRRCENCLYFGGGRCSVHKIKVRRLDVCSRFHVLKILYGGSFSPK